MSAAAESPEKEAVPGDSRRSAKALLGAPPPGSPGRDGDKVDKVPGGGTADAAADSPVAEPAAAEGSVESAPTSDDVGSRLKSGKKVREFAEFVRLQEEAGASLFGDGQPGGRRSAVYILGDVTTDSFVGGDMRIGPPSQDVLGDMVTGEVAASTVRRLGRTFVPPSCYEALRERLERRAVALLEAPAGWGRTTVGLVLLAELCPNGVRNLNPDADLRTLPTDGLDDEAGYLLEVRSVEQLRRIKVPHLAALGTACHERRIRLLVTVDASVEVAGDVRAEFGLAGGTRPDVEAVLRRHLARRLGAPDPSPSDGDAPDSDSPDSDSPDGDAPRSDSPANDSPAGTAPDGDAPEGEQPDRVELLLAEDGPAALVADVLDPTLSMREVVELAHWLAELAVGSRTLGHIRSYYGEQRHEEFVAWFGGQPERSGRALLLALAVFNGMPYFTVSRRWRELEELIRKAEVTDELDERPPVFGPPRSQRLAEARAELFELSMPTAYGDRQVEAVRFRNQTYPRRVLTWVWHEHDVARDMVIDWLTALGRDPDRAVRIRAATATGFLATFEFEWVRRRILLRWADSADQDERESAVAALGPASRGHDLAAPVLRMLRDWVKTGSARRQWTAARALGASVGRANRTEAIKLLRTVAAEDDFGLSLAVGESLVELFVTAEDEQAHHDVLRAVTRWSRARLFRRRQTAIVCFLLLASDVRMRDQDDTSWPALLLLADRDEVARARVVELWHKALRVVPFVPLAQEIFAEWVKVASESPDVVAALGRLMPDLAEDDYDRDRFVHNLTRLRDSDESDNNDRRDALADAAGALLDVLGRKDGGT